MLIKHPVLATVVVRKAESGDEMDSIFEIRQKVFVEEQKVDAELEYDEFEETSVHYIAELDGKAIGTARWRHTPNGIKLERFAVMADSRNCGIGSQLVQKILEDLPFLDNVYLHSQIQACKLYERHGFVIEGEEFIEADIRHFKMVLKP